ncbi:MAG: alpha/beta hydrolase [Pseudomonadota bacterium]
MGKGLDSFTSALKKGAIFSGEALTSLPERKDEITAGINGLMGDLLEREKSSLAINMGFYENKEPLKLETLALKNAIPDATPRLCIFLHGNMDSELGWEFEDDPETSYGTLLRRDFGCTPLYVRYNSGLHISENGKRLSRLIAELSTVFPVETEEIILIGHSMGGLVVRSACYYADKDGEAWVKKVKKVFLIGSPHMGAYMEKIGNLTSVILKLILNPYTRIISGIINMRSSGMKDTRFGYLLDEDWKGKDPDTLLSSNRHPVALLEGVDHYVISSTIKDPGHPVSLFIGDGVVSRSSAAGKALFREDGIAFPEENFRSFSNIGHPRLRRHPDVYEQIREWMKR